MIIMLGGFKSYKEVFSLETRVLMAKETAINSAFLSAIEKATIRGAINSETNSAINSDIYLATHWAGLSELPVRYRGDFVRCRVVFVKYRMVSSDTE